MKCHNCGADLTDDVKMCPFCKEPMLDMANPMFDKFDFKYTITSDEQIRIIRDAVNETSSEKQNISKILKPAGTRKKIRRIKKVDLRTRKNRRKRDKSKKKGLVLGSAFSNLSPQNKMYVAFYGAIALIVLVILCGVFLVGSIANRDRNIEPIAYCKDNSVYLNTGKKPVMLTDNAISLSSIFPEDASSEEEIVISDIIKKSNLIKNSENGMYTYFYENYDVQSSSGNLIRIFNGKKKKLVSNAVHNSFVISPDGKEVLFLHSADNNGDMGGLCYWNDKMDEPRRIASDIDKNTFMFSRDGKSVIYIRNYNYTTHGGDLCVINIENPESECVTIDSEVYEIYGTDLNGKKYIYSKAYDEEKKSYDLYVKTESSERVRIFEKASKKPVISDKVNGLLTYAYNDGKMYSLYDVDLKNYKAVKVASQITDIIKLSDDHKQILYNKVYSTSRITDCYYYEKGKKTVKAADNVSILSSKYKYVSQFSVSDDFKTAVYISGFDENRGGGKLFKIDLTKDDENTEKISDDAYTCRISADGKRIIYGKDYSKARDSFDLYVYQSGKSINIKNDIESSFYGMSKNRENLIFIENYNHSGDLGVLNIINKKNKVEAVFSDVSAFANYGEKGVIFFKNQDNAGNWEISISKGDGKKEKLIDKGVSAVIYH